MTFLAVIGWAFIVMGAAAVLVTPFRGGSTQAVLGAFAIAIGTVLLVAG